MPPLRGSCALRLSFPALTRRANEIAPLRGSNPPFAQPVAKLFPDDSFVWIQLMRREATIEFLGLLRRERQVTEFVDPVTLRIFAADAARKINVGHPLLLRLSFPCLLQPHAGSVIAMIIAP